MMGEYDIALAEAQINWGPLEDDNLPAVEVVGKLIDDDARYENSWGACNSEFELAPSEKKLEMLLAQFIYITTIDGIPVGSAFDAFRQIPEFRSALNGIGWQDD